jgi:triosephosphate isomerase
MAQTLIAGNWKMNGLKASLSEIDAVASGLETAHKNATALLCMPATLVALAADRAGEGALKIGGETCHTAESGAHTGDVSAEMLVDAGASHIIVGHSERRADHDESDAVVASQAAAAHRAGAVPIICVGESLEQREAGQTLDVISAQLAGSIPDTATRHPIVIAYEPIWAIGTGKVATTEQIGVVHTAIRSSLVEKFGASGQDISILYGGSMKPGNAADILAVENVNGGLIGGASLKADDFLAIYSAAK